MYRLFDNALVSLWKIARASPKGRRSPEVARSAQRCSREKDARACTITVYCESIRNAHDARGFVVSWISVYSGEHNVHKEDRNALSYTSLHSCTCWRAILVTAWQPSTRRLLDVCHPNMRRNLDSISLGRQKAVAVPCKARGEPCTACEKLSNLLDIIIYATYAGFLRYYWRVRCKIGEA